MLISFTDQDGLNNFQISRHTFLYLCDKLSSRLQKQDTVMRLCISVQKRVAITLWCLATPAEYRTVYLDLQYVKLFMKHAQLLLSFC